VIRVPAIIGLPIMIFGSEIIFGCSMFTAFLLTVSLILYRQVGLWLLRPDKLCAE
jgi:hypothetical protein